MDSFSHPFESSICLFRPFSVSKIVTSSIDGIDIALLQTVGVLDIRWAVAGRFVLLSVTTHHHPVSTLLSVCQVSGRTSDSSAPWWLAGGGMYPRPVTSPLLSSTLCRRSLSLSPPGKLATPTLTPTSYLWQHNSQHTPGTSVWAMGRREVPALETLGVPS